MAEAHKLTDWLNDAYGMEQAQIEMLERVMKDFDDDPEIRNHIESHKIETERQRERLVDCLDRLGEKPSKVKAVVGNFMGATQGISTKMYKDDKIKDMMTLHAGEHFEHASYLALAEAARCYSQEEIATICEKIADEELRVAKWSGEQVPRLVQQYVARELQPTR